MDLIRFSALLGQPALLSNKYFIISYARLRKDRATIVHYE